MDVSSDEIFIGEIDPRRRNCPGDHLMRSPEEILIVGAVVGAIREDDRGLPAATRTPAALRVVGWCGWHIAEIHRIELSDVYAELHRRRAIEDRELRLPKALLTVLAQCRRYLGSVLSSF